MNNRRVSYLLLAVSLMVILALWGSGIASAQSGTTTNVKITETEFKLDPATIMVPANTPVQFTVTNAGTIEHNLQFELPSQNIEKKLFDQNLKPGETKTGTFTFTAAGDWQMYCPVDSHETAGMAGTVKVVAAQGSAAGATAGANATASSSQSSSASGATAAATATPTGPRTLPVTGSVLGVAGVDVAAAEALEALLERLLVMADDGAVVMAPDRAPADAPCAATTMTVPFMPAPS